MILSKIEQLKSITATNSQRINIKCDDCGKQWNSTLINQINGYKKYNKDLCRGCKQHYQVILGIRRIQYINAGISAKKKLSGKTLEEIVGEERALALKEQNSNANKGEKNANFGGKYSHGWGNKEWQGKFKGKTIEEIWGEEKGKELRKHYSETRKGENNNMYGKPSPSGSGNGWSGWYKDWYFRSLKELSYMIYVIERFNLKWETAENSKYKIEYFDHKENKRTYHPDFLINDKFLVEIKPKRLWNSDNVKRKKEAALKFCKENNFIYKLTECTKQISYKEIDDLIKQQKLIFIKRYQEKYDNYIRNLT